MKSLLVGGNEDSTITFVASARNSRPEDNQGEMEKNPKLKDSLQNALTSTPKKEEMASFFVNIFSYYKLFDDSVFSKYTFLPY